jgi:thiol-disulfide isomerase/thioredoxin
MTSKMRDGIMTLLTNKKILIIISLAALFIGLALWVYKKYIVPRINAAYVPNKEYIRKDVVNNNSADLYFFYTNWCPHSKSAKITWDKFKDSIETSGHSSGVKINFIEVDCDNDQATANKFNVSGYPTIKLVYNKKIVEYDAKPQIENLQQFLDETLN